MGENELFLEVNERFAKIKEELRAKGPRQLEFLRVINVSRGKPAGGELLLDFLYSEASQEPTDELIDSLVPREFIDFADSIGFNDPGLRELIRNVISIMVSSYRRNSQRTRSLLREQVIRENALANYKKKDQIQRLQLEADLERVNREVDQLRASGILFHVNECMSIVALMLLKLNAKGVGPEELILLARQHVPLGSYMSDFARQSDVEETIVLIEEELKQADSIREVVDISWKYRNELTLEEWERLLKSHSLGEQSFDRFKEMFNSQK